MDSHRATDEAILWPYNRSQSFSGKTVGLGRKPNSKTICIIQPFYLFQKHLLNINNMLFLRHKRKTKYGKPDMLVDFCFSCASVFEGCLGCDGPPSVGGEQVVCAIHFADSGWFSFPDAFRGVRNLNPALLPPPPPRLILTKVFFIPIAISFMIVGQSVWYFLIRS